MTDLPPAAPHDAIAEGWSCIEAALDAWGVAHVGSLLTVAQCKDMVGLNPQQAMFRSRVVMGRHGFGEGEYQCFRYPLPSPIAGWRGVLYARLAPIPNRWHKTLGIDRRFPPTLDAFLAECRAAGQARPAPLLLKYRPGDFNCLHQDLYGAISFPFQVVVLSRPGVDFQGGEFVLVEQRPRMQARAEVVALAQGEAAIFSVTHQPVRGARGSCRVTLRHGVSRVREGSRFTAGIVFHVAR